MVYEAIGQSQASKKTKEIYTYQVILASRALDADGVPEDTQIATVYLSEYPFPWEIEKKVQDWIDLGYEVKDSFKTLHQRFDEEKKVLVDIWNPPIEM